jgi:hypothetical protein
MLPYIFSFSDIVIKALYMKIYNPTTPPPNISYMYHQIKLTYISPEGVIGMERLFMKMNYHTSLQIVILVSNCYPLK